MNEDKGPDLLVSGWGSGVAMRLSTNTNGKLTEAWGHFGGASFSMGNQNG